MQYVKDVISERVQLEVDAYLRKMTDESNTANDMDTTEFMEKMTNILILPFLSIQLMIGMIIR